MDFRFPVFGFRFAILESQIADRKSEMLCVLCLFMYCVLCSAEAYADGEDPPYPWKKGDTRILETLPNGLVIQFRMPELEVDTKKVEVETRHAVSLQILSFRDCSFTHEVGKAQIPIRVFSLGIPDASEPSVSVLDAESSLLTGYRLYPVEKPVIRNEETRERGGEDLLPHSFASTLPPSSYAVETEFAMDREFYRQSEFYPAALAEIEPMGYVRQQRVARLEFHPIQYSPATGQLKVYKRLEVRVTFSMKSLKPSKSLKSLNDLNDFNGFNEHQEDVFEDLYRDALLNYEQARNWRKERGDEGAREQVPAPTLPRSATPSSLLSLAPSLPHSLAPTYKLTIERDGIYRLDYKYLTRAGIDPSTIDPRKMELQSAGERIPIYVEGYQDGKFDPDDFIEFYAVKMDSIYTDANVYWLSWGTLGSAGAKSWMMAIKDGTPGQDSGLKTQDSRPTTPPIAFLDTEHWERDVYYDPLKKVTAETADHFFWSTMRGQDPRHNRKSDIPLNLPFRVYDLNKPATLRICFQGVTFARGASNHRVNIYFNGVPAGTAEWEGQTEYISETTLSQRDLNRFNYLALHCEDDNKTSDATDPKWDLYLNWIEIDYWREFTADNNRLQFSTETFPPVTRTVQYAVRDFSRSDIEVFQIARAGAIAKIINPKVVKEGASYTVLFEDKVDQPTRYFVTSIASMMQPSGIVEDQPSTLHDPANRADYITVTHRDFRESAERLADFRRKQGLDVIVVDIEDVYDEFSYGVFDPKAIKRFLRYAYFNWDKIPTYVLLIGDAHWDYKYVYHDNYVRYENYPRIYVPTYHAWSSPFGQTAMDHRFVTVSGDDILPDMLIGRIPAESAQEANIAVDKIIKYEDRPYRGPWQSRVLLVADDEKSKSGDEVFEDSRVDLANNYIPVGYEVVDVYLRRVGEPYIARKMVNMEMNRGVVMLEYAGHGGAHSWAHEYIFGWEDVGKLQNYNKYSFVITTTCENGYFDNPAGGNKSIMELFLLKPNGGAVACLSATRLTYGQGNATFDKILYPKIFSEKPPILGKIINAAKIDFINLGIATWVPSAEQYTLFGDPATRLALPGLDIECELARSSVDSSQQLELMPGSIKRLKLDPLTSEKKLVTDAGFNAQMRISVVYPNNLDEDKSNDLPIQSGSVNVWRGEFGEVLLTIPNGVIPGVGRLRCYASSGSSSAIGGIQFRVSEPLVEFYSGRIINDESLQVHAAVVDNLGQAGIKSVECVWHSTETWTWHTNIMIPSVPPPGAPEVEGLWYTLKDNIPLSRPGTSIEYKIKVIDTERNEVISPLQKTKVPIGVNLAISRPEPFMSPGISYSYDSGLGAWILSAPVENNGGKEVKQPVTICFFEGNPDRNRDNVIDSDAKMLGSAVVEDEEWKPGERVIQAAEVSIKLDEPLSSGFHQIFVWINPRASRLDGQLEIQRVEDADKSDDKASRLFQINEFLVGKGNQATRAQSLDAALSMVIPPGSLDETIMSITGLELPESNWEQPDLTPAPIPEYGGTGIPACGSAFRIQLASGVTSLRESAQIDIKFDVMKVRELAKESKGLAGKSESQLSRAEREWLATATQEEAKKLGIFAWQEDIGVWRYVPSELVREGEAPADPFVQEPYVTLPISENRCDTQLDAVGIMVDEIITPLGNWVVFFLDSDRYKVYLRREGLKTYESFAKSGEVGKTYHNDDVGLSLTIPSPSPSEAGCSFGDVLKFDTYQDMAGTIKLKSLRNYNSGDGTARITIISADKFPEVSNVAGEWAIFFTGPGTFEVHSQLGHLVRDSVGFPVEGETGKDILIPTIGVEAEIHEGRWPFQFGDKFVFKTLFAGTVRAQTDVLNTMTLMHNNDFTPPSIQLWVNGLIPQNGAVIPPLPTISLLLSDANGIDIDSLSFLMSVDDRDFHPVPTEDYVFGAGYPTVKPGVEGTSVQHPVSSIEHVPIFYSPILNIGKYRFRISVMDFSGNRAPQDTRRESLDSGVETRHAASLQSDFMFLVEKQPDLSPPTINVTVDGQNLFPGQIFKKSPEFLINIDDDHALDEASISVSLSAEGEPLEPLEENEYTMTISEDTKNAVIIYTPHLMNGEYAIQVEAVDTSDNAAYLTPPEAGVPGYAGIGFRVDEEVEVRDVMNTPNPLSESTVFTYSLNQPADKVTIKIYTLRGRLVRTLEQDSPRWQYNEEFWDGRDEDGYKLASGAYLYKFIVTDADRKIERIGKLAIVR